VGQTAPIFRLELSGKSHSLSFPVLLHLKMEIALGMWQVLIGPKDSIFMSFDMCVGE
jgi:hypothetical protein